MKNLLFIILICLGCFHSNAQLNFSAPVKYHIGTDPRSICTGDFNNDGVKDLVAYCTTLNRVAVLTGNSNGSFTTPANYTNINNGVGGLFIMSADFNNDGYDDLACANLYQKAVHILYGSGIPSFSNIVTYTFNSRPTCIDYHDVDNDGKNDLIIGGKSMDSIYVMKGDGVGGFTIINRFKPNLSVWPINLTSIDIADLNNDGNADMVINEPSKDSLLVYSGNGTGQFIYHSSIKNDVSSYQIVLKDLNGDGNMDLISANSPNFYIFHGDGNSGFALPNIYTPSVTLGVSPKVAIADFNMDGYLDLVFSSVESDSSEVYIGSGNGTFIFELDLNLSILQSDLLSSDFNNDGKPDLAYVHNNDSVTILLNKTIVENVEEQDFSFQFHVYPNPVSNHINIECDNQFKEIQVYNVFSELVLEKHYQGIRQTELDLSNLKSGIYILKVDNSYIQRLTIKSE
jgi:hypothetical protein